MKKAFCWAMTVTAIAVPAMPAYALTHEMPGGLWEIRTKMEIPGLPPEVAEKMGTVRTMKHCVKPGERRWHDQQRGPGDRAGKCDPVEPKIEGNKVSWTLKCENLTGQGVLTHNGKDAYTMDMTMNAPQGTMKIHNEGRRLAETCEK